MFLVAALLLMVLAPGGSAALAAPAVSAVPSQTLCAQTLWLLSELQSEMETAHAVQNKAPCQISGAEFHALTQDETLSSTHKSFFDTVPDCADETSQHVAPHLFARRTPVIAQLEYSLSSHEAAFRSGARPLQFLE
jgi:hypothetical protein